MMSTAGFGGESRMQSRMAHALVFVPAIWDDEGDEEPSPDPALFGTKVGPGRG